MLAVASIKRSLEFDPVEQGAKRKRAEMKLSPPSSPISSSATSSSSSTFSVNANPTSPSKQQQSIFNSSPSKTSSLVVQKPCALTALTTAAASNDDIPMFTYAEATQICARRLREMDRSLRDQYEKLLTDKLVDQYDTFIRYTHDSVHKNQSKQASSNRLFHFGQQQETKNSTSPVVLSYVS
jgi:hypothetical protein